MSNAELKRRLRLAALSIAAIAFAAAFFVFLFAEEPPPEASDYVVVNGKILPAAGGDSKIYRNQLERYGGKSMLLLDDFNRWFAGLWQGTKLAKTIAWIGAIAALVLLLIAQLLPVDAYLKASDKERRR